MNPIMCGATRMVVAAAGLSLTALLAAADPATNDGEERALFVARCSICHSVDYVEMHAAFATPALWQAEVNKMRKTFKAPLSDDEARILVDYLSRNYRDPRQP
ncbi:MAG: cytochrome c [Gammaproteobacteria bacterium]|nr:cytochrome c [Gammaproteobacteria bacterium]